jgi:NADH dehydrogenase (ubiquinone) Fe-S protein 3
MLITSFLTRYLTNLSQLLSQFGLIKEAYLIYNEISFLILPNRLVDCASFMKLHTLHKFQQCTDVVVTDYPSKLRRFVISYILLAPSYNMRIILKTQLNEITPIFSLTSLYSSINWSEREIWDLFGVFFINHPDLRRILNDYGFKGHALRKDFPLTGFYEVNYNGNTNSIDKTFVETAQEFRIFYRT